MGASFRRMRNALALCALGAASLGAQAQMTYLQGLPCPPGMGLIVMPPAMIPVCEGVAMPFTPMGQVAGAALGSLGDSATGAAADAATSAAASSGNANAASAAGATGAMGPSAGFAMEKKIISCEEYSQVKKMTNPGNGPTPTDESGNPPSDWQINNGWYEQKLSYTAAYSGMVRSGFGGAVMSRTTGMNGGNWTVESEGQCELLKVPPPPPPVAGS